MKFSLLQKLSLCGLAAAISTIPSMAANVPAGYSVYSYEELKIGNSAGVNGGYIGGKATVLLGNDAKVTGSILANGAVTMYDRSRVDGDVKSGKAVTLINGATIGGSKVPNTTLPVYTIPTKTVPVGTISKNIPDRTSQPLAPGNYSTVTIGNASIATLSSGVYNINSLIIRPDAVLKLNFPATGSITINVRSSFLYGERVVMQFLNCADGSKITVYYHGTSELAIGNNSVVFGAFSAPNALVTVRDRAVFNGSVFAKKVDLQPGLFAASMVDQWLKVDTDADGVPDYVESSCGTNPGNASDKPSKMNTGTYANKTMLGPQTVRMSVGTVAGYSHVADFPITLSKNSVKGDLIPVNNLVDNPPSDTVPLATGFRLDGSKYHSVTGELQPGKKVLFAFPISDLGSGLTKDLTKLSHFNEQSGNWEDVPIAYVTGNAVYAFVFSFSTYAVSGSDAVYRVNSLTDLGTTFATIAADQVGKPTKKYYVYLNKGTYTATQGYTIPLNTNLIGGFDFATMSANLNDPVANDPKKNRTIIDGSNITDPMIKMTDNLPANTSIGSIVDGIEFYKSKSELGALVFYAGSAHNTNIHILNCVFEEATSVRVGGIFLFNVSNVHIESCVFVNNTVTGQNMSGAASAIHISQAYQCGVAARIHSCIFINNKITSTTASPSGTICNRGDFGDAEPPDGKYRTARPVDIFNCTFYNNTTANTSGGSVAYREIQQMPMSVQNCLIYEFPVTTNYIYEGTVGMPGVTLPGVINKTGTVVNPPADNFVSTSSLIGDDNKWGTGDDGLRLKIGSDLCHTIQKSAYFSARDVTGRYRKNGEGGTLTHEYQDLGAYETYVNVLTVGSANTLGIASVSTDPNDGWCYQAKLKSIARTNGFLIDFLGTGNSTLTYGVNCYTGLGEDPSVPNTIITGVGNTNATINAYDIQMAASPTAGFTDFATFDAEESKWTINEALVEQNFDFALVNIGDKEVFTAATPKLANTFADFKAIVSSFATEAAGKKVLLSTPVLDNGEILASFISSIRGAQASDFGTAIFSNDSKTGWMDQDDEMIDQHTNRNIIDTEDGYTKMATVWWNLMNTFLDD